jgi:hypothetical protein
MEASVWDFGAKSKAFKKNRHPLNSIRAATSHGKSNGVLTADYNLLAYYIVGCSLLHD